MPNLPARLKKKEQVNVNYNFSFIADNVTVSRTIFRNFMDFLISMPTNKFEML